MRSRSTDRRCLNGPAKNNGSVIATGRFPNMPIYMDVHRELGDVTEEDICAAHARDLAVQDEFGVRFLTFWFNQPDGQAFCLVEPDRTPVRPAG